MEPKPKLPSAAEKQREIEESNASGANAEPDVETAEDQWRRRGEPEAPEASES
jgi:hypothetical protein